MRSDTLINLSIMNSISILISIIIIMIITILSINMISCLGLVLLLCLVRRVAPSSERCIRSPPRAPRRLHACRGTGACLGAKYGLGGFKRSAAKGQFRKCGLTVMFELMTNKQKGKGVQQGSGIQQLPLSN